MNTTASGGLFLILSILLAACHHGPTDVSTGTIAGYATLYDENRQPLSDHAGVRVSIEGTRYSGVTDAAGLWSIEDVPAGNYHLLYEKDGYALHRRSIQFVGSGTFDAGNPGIYPMATWQVESVGVDVVSEDRIALDGNISWTPVGTEFREVAVFFSFDPTPLDTLTEEKLLVVLRTLPNSDEVRNQTSLTVLRNRGGISGQTVYLTAYPMTQLVNYRDEQTQRLIYTSLTRNGTASALFVVP